MSESQAQQEPSIEEILASIRRIISDDGDTGEEAAEAAPDPAATPATAPVDDVLELTERIDLSPPGPDPEPERDPLPPPIRAEPPAEPPRVAAPRPEASMQDHGDDEDALVSAPTAQRTTDVLSRLAPRDADRSYDPLPIPHRTLEEVVREMLRPMLREWLDTHLTGIVERAVERELRRMSRRAEELH
jgi:cell pole-organizing protein PopZ